MKKIYIATSDAHDEEEDKRPHLFVSIDDEQYHEVAGEDGESLAPEDFDAESYPAVERLFGPQPGKDGRMFQRISLAKRYIRLWTKNPVFHDPIEVPE